MKVFLLIATAACAYKLPPAPLSRAQRQIRLRPSHDVPDCCPPFGPPAPPPFPAKYVTKWQTQPVDHFNYLAPTDPTTLSRSTFQQRILYYDGHWAGGAAPIIVIPCVEAGPATYYWGEYGWVVDTLAANLSALVVFAEHRYFGATVPGGTPGGWYPDSTHLGVLTEAQAMEDLNLLTTALRTNLSAWDSPVIAVGGSLAGEMSTWWRVRYPFMVDMALAGSAPILGFPGLTDPYGWDRVVTDAFRSTGGQACVDSIRAGYWQTSALGPAAVNAAFNPCTPATESCAGQQVADLVMDWTGGAAEASYPPTLTTSSVLVICNAMAGAASGVAAYEAALAPLVPGQCLNIQWSQCGSAANQTKVSSATAVSRSATDACTGYCCTNWQDPSCQDGWGFESCTTEIHPILGNNVTDFYPPDHGPYNGTERLLGCRSLYGGNLSIDELAMPRGFGQLDLARMAASASRIIFSSGTFDPWSAQSINVTMSPSLPFVLIQGGAHHSDLGGPMNPVPTPDDLPSVVQAREFHISTLARWVKEFHEERATIKERLGAAGIAPRE